ncbi:diaminopimelate epimerase [Mycobacterium sp. 155]|uniref:diaminopimelate epimerase n=1 Tax=Mycobacterium sp. 155 TaxID=1157943 RepID=UPI001E3F29EE|nr:diaminopimelate epimerase [Mycobacterium sp. 155]
MRRSSTPSGSGGTYPDQVIFGGVSSVKGLRFVKGHGTQNDFVVLPDLDARLSLQPDAVAALCDRRRGLGADGVLRVTTAGAALAAGVFDRLPDGVAADDWYMDYRNADGSIAQMCGNGVRVFAHYLKASGLETADEFVVGSLAGPRPVVLHHADADTAEVTVEMGKANRFGAGSAVVGGRSFSGLAVDVGNPHLACVGIDQADLVALDVGAPVSFDSALFPHGVNVEILTAPVDGVVNMRVHERGVGETRSCGTGTVAATVAALAHEGTDTGTLQVRIPGGEVSVTVTESTSYLRGPSVLVARGELSEAWWNTAHA